MSKSGGVKSKRVNTWRKRKMLNWNLKLGYFDPHLHKEMCLPWTAWWTSDNEYKPIWSIKKVNCQCYIMVLELYPSQHPSQSINPIPSIVPRCNGVVDTIGFKELEMQLYPTIKIGRNRQEQGPLTCREHWTVVSQNWNTWLRRFILHENYFLKLRQCKILWLWN